MSAVLPNWKRADAFNERAAAGRHRLLILNAIFSLRWLISRLPEASQWHPVFLRKRLQLFEFLDLPWVGGWVRQAMLEYLNFLLYRMAQPYRGVEQILSDWASKGHHTTVLDMGSGGGGHVDWLIQRGDALRLPMPKFVLSDLFPGANLPTWKTIQASHGTSKVGYLADPVDACAPEVRTIRLRSMFSIFHHLTPEQARQMLASACSDSDGILVAEGVRRAVLPAVMMAMLLPVYMFVMPLAAPHFTARRLLFSMVIPIIPLMMAFDGIASVLRAYTADEMISLFPEDAERSFEIKAHTFHSLGGIFATTVVTASRRSKDAGASSQSTSRSAG